MAQEFWERRSLNVINLLSFLSPLGERCGPFFFYKLKFPSPKAILCQFWKKLAQWLWRRQSLKVKELFSLFRYHLPSEAFVRTWIPITQECFLPTLIEIGPVVLNKNRKWQKCKKFTKMTDKVQISTRKALAFNSDKLTKWTD